jgi:hypothetical protein
MASGFAPKTKRRRERRKESPWAESINDTIRGDLVRWAANMRANLKQHRPEPKEPEPEPAAPHDIVFTEELPAKMFANLAARGMTKTSLVERPSWAAIKALARRCESVNLATQISNLPTADARRTSRTRCGGHVHFEVAFL